ncbi:hypothetical protein CPC16_011720 [Podila verticillata]|nr:hypothetical protein CPC16_011720 [Podila verticillata]
MRQSDYLHDAGEGSFPSVQNSDNWSEAQTNGKSGHTEEDGIYSDQEGPMNNGEDDKEYYTQDEDDLGPEIYGDFHLSLPKRTAKPAAKHSTPTKKSPETLRTAHLEISLSMDPILTFVPPEIIRIVCSFASQQTLRCVLMLVCKEWYHLGKPFIRRTGRWIFGTQESEDTLLKRLRSRHIHELHLHYDTEFKPFATSGREEPFNNEETAWIRFFSAITTPVYLSRNDSTLNGLEAMANLMESMVLEDTAVAKRSLLSSVQNVYVSSKSLWQPCLMPALLPHLGGIHTIELSQELSTGSIPLFTILDHCHGLQKLTIKGAQTHTPNDMTMIYDGITHTTSTTAATSSGAANMGLSYPLKIFSVSGVALEIGALKRLIPSCPHMQEFKASDVCFWIFRGDHTVKVFGSETHLHFAPLYRLAASHCPDLSEFCIMGLQSSYLHRAQPVAEATVAISAQVLQHINLTVELFPHTRAMSLPTVMSGSWEPNRGVCLYLSRLTHLTLTHRLLSILNMDKILRCARSLLSLIAPHSELSAIDPLQIEDEHKRILDVVRKKRLQGPWDARYKCYSVSVSREAKLKERVRHRLERQGAAARGDLPHPTRWLCKHLQTLDIGVHLFKGTFVRYPVAGEPKKFFTLLAKSCPGLVDLTLRMSVLHLGQRMHRTRTVRVKYIPPRKMANPSPRPERMYYREGGRKVELQERFVDFSNDLLLLCGDRAAGEAPRLVHLKRIVIFASVPGNVCASDFDFLGKDGGGNDVSWPALELFKIVTGASWTIVDHPQATKTGEETMESLLAKVKARRHGLELQLM